MFRIINNDRLVPLFIFNRRKEAERHPCLVRVHHMCVVLSYVASRFEGKWAVLVRWFVELRYPRHGCDL